MMRKILLQILIFTAIFVAIFSINRFIMAQNFLTQTTTYDIFLLYALGAFHDIRFLSAAFLPLLICGFLSYFSKLIRANLKKLIIKIYTLLSSIYIGILGFLCVIFAFIKFYYYEIYQTKIDIFIFGLKNDNTQAIFEIILKDYPVFQILILSIFLFGICVFLNYKILNLKLKNFNLNLKQFIALNLILIIFYIIALRGPFRRVIMNANNHSISTNMAINHLAINPLMAAKWAYKHYKESQNLKLPQIDTIKIKNLEKTLFPLFSQSPKNEKAAQIKPSIVLNLMESFGLNLAQFSNDNLNLLGGLQKHFKQDFIFTRFLSSTSFTTPAIANLIFLSPFPEISQSKFQHDYLTFTPIEIYKKAGYKIYFITGGNGAWKNLNHYFKILGVDEIIDENNLLKEYPSAWLSKNTYGVADEFMYKKIYDLLQKNPHNTLIITLSISNHPPFKIPQNSLNLDNVPTHLLELLPYEEEKQKNILNAYAYANLEFSKFLDKIKKSDFKNSVIIAATGDHRVRELKSNSNSQKALNYAVPFYLYIPKPLQNNFYYNPNRVGSHKDIFPTLYALSLSEVKYLSLGGRNLLAKAQNQNLEFGFNETIWIDEFGIYPRDEAKGYFYENNTSLKNATQSFDLDEFHLNFFELYDELNWLQLALRLKK